jgi:LPXTG-motif cell wall-anchored protein
VTTPAETTTPDTEEVASGEDENQPDEGGVQGENAAGGEEETTPVATASPSPEASGSELPFTGMNAWWVGVLGLTLAGTGVVLRRRSTG